MRKKMKGKQGRMGGKGETGRDRERGEERGREREKEGERERRGGKPQCLLPFLSLFAMLREPFWGKCAIEKGSKDRVLDNMCFVLF